MGDYESDFPFEHGCRFDELYEMDEDNEHRYIRDPYTGDRIYKLKPNAVFLLTELMRLEDYRSTKGPPP